MDWNGRSSEKLNEINKLLEQLPQTPQSSLWYEANDAATNALFNSGKTADLLSPVMNEIGLDLEKAKNISRRIDSTEKDIQEIRKQFERIAPTIPSVKQYTYELENHQKILEI